MSNITTGLNTQAKVVITSGTPDLVLVGAEQRLTFQLVASIKDVNGNTQYGELYYVSRDPSIVTVSDTGLITAHAEGTAIVEVSTPAFGNTITTVNPDGSPLNKVYAEQKVTVLPGEPVLPSFSFELSQSSVTVSPGGSATVTITQTVTEVDGVGPGPVSYRISAASGGGCAFGDSSTLDMKEQIVCYTNLGQITGNSSLSFTFGAVDGAVPQTISTYVYGVAYLTNAAQPLQVIQPITITVS